MQIRITDNLIKEADTYLYEKVQELRPLISGNGTCTLTRRRYSSFQSLIRSIISQQLSNKASRSIFVRLENLVKNGNISPNNIAEHSITELRSIGISNSKAKFILGLAEDITTGRLNLRNIARLSDSEAKEALTKVRGIGNWTAEMYLIFHLKRPDVISVADIGIKRAVQNAYSLTDKPSDEELLSISKIWKPYRSIACWHLWKSLDNG